MRKLFIIGIIKVIIVYAVVMALPGDGHDRALLAFDRSGGGARRAFAPGRPAPGGGNAAHHRAGRPQSAARAGEAAGCRAVPQGTGAASHATADRSRSLVPPARAGVPRSRPPTRRDL